MLNKYFMLKHRNLIDVFSLEEQFVPSQIRGALVGLRNVALAKIIITYPEGHNNF